MFCGVRKPKLINAIDGNYIIECECDLKRDYLQIVKTLGVFPTKKTLNLLMCTSIERQSLKYRSSSDD